LRRRSLSVRQVGAAEGGGVGIACRARRASWTSAGNSSAWPRTALRTLSFTAERGASRIWPVYQVLARIDDVAIASRKTSCTADDETSMAHGPWSSHSTVIWK